MQFKLLLLSIVGFSSAIALNSYILLADSIPANSAKQIPDGTQPLPYGSAQQPSNIQIPANDLTPREQAQMQQQLSRQPIISSGPISVGDTSQQNLPQQASAPLAANDVTLVESAKTESAQTRRQESR